MVKYFDGDLLKSDCNMICHQVNCQGVMGAGIALQIRNQYPTCYEAYKQVVHTYGKEKCLGRVYFYAHASGKFIANMFSQFDFSFKNIVNTDYDAFRSCLLEIKEYVNLLTQNDTEIFKIGFPYKIGCGLAGGDWNIIKQIIEEEFVDDIWNVEIWRFEK